MGGSHCESRVLGGVGDAAGDDSSRDDASAMVVLILFLCLGDLRETLMFQQVEICRQDNEVPMDFQLYACRALSRSPQPQPSLCFASPAMPTSALARPSASCRRVYKRFSKRRDTMHGSASSDVDCAVNQLQNAAGCISRHIFFSEHLPAVPG